MVNGMTHLLVKTFDLGFECLEVFADKLSDDMPFFFVWAGEIIGYFLNLLDSIGRMHFLKFAMMFDASFRFADSGRTAADETATDLHCSESM